ncbi:MAG: M28 family peptidase [Pseudomonadales bacterium]
MKLLPLLCLSALMVGCGSDQSTPNSAAGALTDEQLRIATELRDEVLTSNVAWEVVEDLTTEVGARMPGTPSDAKGVEWMEQRFRDLGFDKVTLEPVEYPLWERHHEIANVVAPFEQPLAITALGGSVGTDGTLVAPVVYFATIDELQEASDEEVEGKIVFINKRMEKTIDGSGYGPVVAGRSGGAKVAGAKGAVAVLIRSVGTDSDRFAHTGMMRYDENIPKIPAAALSNPDADQVERLLERGALTVSMDISAGFTGTYTGHNVIAEVTGSRWPEEIIVIGGHLDSWDLGTGALDDGAGVAVTTAAAHRLLADDARPGRTIRVVAFANEEQGLIGAYQYAAAHEDEIEQHFLGSESDFGAGRVWRYNTNVSEALLPSFEQIFPILEPLGIERGGLTSGGGPDIIPLQQLGVPVVRLSQDGTDYFDYHHTANDTLDKIDPEALNQNVAAWITMVYLASHIPAEAN